MNEINEKTRNQKYPYITVLRIIAAFAVIGIHTVCTPVFLYPDAYEGFSLYGSVFMNNLLTLFAVPIFVMISGALLLNPNKEFSLKKFLLKNFLRLIYALVLFGIFYCAVEEFLKNKKIDLQFFINTLRNFVEGKSWNHMWYMYMLPGVYLLVPLLRKYIYKSDRSEILYLLFILFLFTCLFPFITKITGIKIGLRFPITSVWLFYFFLGYVIHSEIIIIPKIVDILFIVISVVSLVIEMLIPEHILKGADLLYMTNDSVFAVMLSTGIFSLSKKVFVKDVRNFTKKLSELTFGTYLIHAVFTNFMYKILKFSPLKINFVLMWIIVFFISFFSSVLITWILRFIRPVKKYIL